MSRASAPLLDRQRFRWVNGIGIALTLFFALWLLAFLAARLQEGRLTAPLDLPAAYVVVAALSLVLAAVFLAVVLFGYVFRGADVGQPLPRYLLYAWTCAAGLFFLSQAVALARFGAVPFPAVPSWLAALYWYFVPIGAVVFGLLLWVNAEPHGLPWEAVEAE